MCLSFVSDCNKTWIFSTDFRKYSNIEFRENPLRGSRFLHMQTGGLTGRHDKASCGFCSFSDTLKKTARVTPIDGRSERILCVSRTALTWLGLWKCDRLFVTLVIKHPLLYVCKSIFCHFCKIICSLKIRSIKLMRIMGLLFSFILLLFPRWFWPLGWSSKVLTYNIFKTVISSNWFSFGGTSSVLFCSSSRILYEGQYTA